ncbi:MAG: hypothetical protein WBB07_07045 [Mycobacterium sp.]
MAVASSEKTRNVLSWGCWATAWASGLTAGWLLPDGEWAPWLLVAAALLALAGVFLHPVLSLRAALLPFAALAAAFGLGAVSVATMAASAAAAVAIELQHGRLRGRAELRRRVGTDGTATTGTVVWAWRYYVGAIPMTRVAVQYVDDNGNQQRAKTTADGVVPKGAQVRLRYLPEHPTTIAVVRS